jgi:MFS family permease
VPKLGRQRQEPAAPIGLSAPLRRPDFRRLAASYALNELGDWLGIVALAVLVFDRTDSALAMTALFLGTRFVPAVLTPPIVTRFEQTPPRFSLATIYCCEAAAFGALAILANNFFLLAVVALAAIDGTLALMGRSLTRAVTTAMLEPAGELRSGNAILNIGFTGGAAVGPALGGLVVAGLGIQSALLLDALSFLLIAALMFAGPLPHAEPEEDRWTDRLRAGLAYVASRMPLRRLLAAQGAAFVFFAAVIPIEVIYAKSTLNAGDSGYGALLASWGIGMVLGSLVFAGLRQRGLPLLLMCSTLAVGASYLGLAAAPTLLAACAISVIGGLGNGVQWVSVVSAIQEMTRSEMQARVMSVLESVGAAMPGVGYLIGGLVAAEQSPRAVFLVAGLGVLAVLAVAVYALAGTSWTKGEAAIGRGDINARAAATPESDNLREGRRADQSGARRPGERFG